jgi:hypothetical protein
MSGEAVGAFVELPVRQLRSLEDCRDGIRSSFGLTLQ